MFNMENSAQKHKTTLLLCPAGEMDRSRGPSGSRSLACLVSRNLTFQLDLRGGIDTVLFLSVLLVLGALGQDHRVRNELLSPWCPNFGGNCFCIFDRLSVLSRGAGRCHHCVPVSRGSAVLLMNQVTEQLGYP